MSDEDTGGFGVSSPISEDREEALMSETVAERRKYLHVTIIDHNPVIDGTDEETYVNIRVPVELAEAGLQMVPEGKLGKIDPDIIVQMVAEGAEGELINIDEGKRRIAIRVE